MQHWRVLLQGGRCKSLGVVRFNTLKNAVRIGTQKTNSRKPLQIKHLQEFLSLSE